MESQTGKKACLGHAQIERLHSLPVARDLCIRATRTQGLILVGVERDGSCALAFRLSGCTVHVKWRQFVVRCVDDPSPPAS